MQQNNLHKLGKTDLLTIIYKQEKQIQQLTKEVEDLKQQLDDRTIKMKEAGSIAEASLKINKIFEVAQQAADEYLKSVKEVNKLSQECAQTDNSTTKDETYCGNFDNFREKYTYERKAEEKDSNRYSNKTEEKNSKELVLVNNKIMVKKPKLLKKVVILLMFICVKISDFMKVLVKETNYCKKRINLCIKTNFIKLKHDIIKLLKCIKNFYVMVKEHLIGFCKYCKLMFPSTVSTLSYKFYIAKRKSRTYIEKVIKKGKLQIRYLKLIITKNFKILCKRSYYKMLKLCNTIYGSGMKVFYHLQGFAKYCKFQFTILKFKIRNTKLFKKKLLEHRIEAQQEKNRNSLIVINNKNILYKINILRIVKKYFNKVNILINKFVKTTNKFILRNWQKFIIILKEEKTIYKKRSSKFAYKIKELLLKVLLHLKELYTYCIQQFKILNKKILNKMHHVKRLNETNEITHIEEPKKTSHHTNIILYKDKLKNRIIKIIKKGIVVFNELKEKVRDYGKVSINFVKQKKTQQEKKNTKLKKKRQIKKAKKQTREEKIENIEISIQQLEEELKKRKDKKIRIKFIKTLSYSAMVIVAFAIITSTSFFKILQVSGSSMEPNLHEGELLITSTFFRFEKGDIIAFYYNDSVLIKRIIATEGDVVNIEDDGTVFVNSVKLEEEYVKKLDYGNCDITFPYQVPKNSVFILGDNREVSIDSRSKALGCISKDKIIGKIKFKLNPFVIY